MIRKLQLLGLIIVISSASFAQVGIGTTSPDASAALDVSATDKGFLMPRMTSVQRTAITSPATSLTVFDTDTNTFWSYVLGIWIEAKPGLGKFIDGATPDIAYYQDRVGIGTDNFSTEHKLYIESIKDVSQTAVKIDATFNGAGTAVNNIGLTSEVNNTGGGTIQNAIGVYSNVINPSDGTMTNAIGSWERVENSGPAPTGYGVITELSNETSGSITDAIGSSLNVYNNTGATIGEVTLGSMYMQNTGTVTGDGYGLWIGGNSTGSIGGSAYALYIATPFTNITGNSYAIFSENTSDSYIEGSLGIGTSTPLQKVHISGAMRLEPQVTAPSGGALGDLYAGTDGNLYFHDGVSWKAVQLVP